nr:hypothetical protein [Tanacetum cinerariifolium]
MCGVWLLQSCWKVDDNYESLLVWLGHFCVFVIFLIRGGKGGSGGNGDGSEEGGISKDKRGKKDELGEGVVGSGVVLVEAVCGGSDVGDVLLL